MFGGGLVSPAAYSSQRRILAAIGLDGRIRLWKPNGHGTPVSLGPPIGRPFGSDVTALGLSPSGDILLCPDLPQPKRAARVGLMA
jgi:hypothetical protein